MSSSRLKTNLVKYSNLYLLRLIEELRVGRVAEALGLIILAVLCPDKSLRAVILFELRVTLRVDSMLLVEELIFLRVFRLDVLPASATPAAGHELNVRKALGGLGPASLHRVGQHRLSLILLEGG